MPFTLSRRQFLSTTSAAAAATAFASASRLAFAQAPSAPAAATDEQLWVLFSDTHIAADPATIAREVNVAEHLRQAVREVLLLSSATKPAGLIVNGDVALTDGQAADYSTVVELMKPLREAGIDTHLTLGNHDDRSHFWAGCQSLDTDHHLVEQKHLAVLDGPVVNWVLLDSLDQVNKTPGLIGEAQLTWLDRTLRELPDKPTLVVSHHNLQAHVADGKKHTGIKDTEALLQVLQAHTKVKAFIYGHTHNWSTSTEPSGLHLINLPPIAYTFNKARPSGWVTARVTAKTLALELHSLDPQHPEHGQKITLPLG